MVSREYRSVGLGHRLVAELRLRAKTLGFDTLTAFTHDARFFVRQGFSIVPHVWVPEKIMTDCVGCPLFRKCEQYAVILPLQAQQTYRAARPQASSAHGPGCLTCRRASSTAASPRRPDLPRPASTAASRNQTRPRTRSTCA